MVEAAKRLKASGRRGPAAGVQHAAQGRTTEIADATGLPILHIGDAAAEQLAADGRNRVALLGTRFTMTEHFIRERYRGARDPARADLNPTGRAEVDRIIYEELAAGRVVRDSQRKLKTLITELGKQKVQAIVLGCTELVLAVDVARQCPAGLRHHRDPRPHGGRMDAGRARRGEGGGLADQFSGRISRDC